MSRSVEFTVDVTAAAGIGRQAHTAVTVILPEVEQLGDQPVICFGLPGAGYSRNYRRIHAWGEMVAQGRVTHAAILAT